MELLEDDDYEEEEALVNELTAMVLRPPPPGAEAAPPFVERPEPAAAAAAAQEEAVAPVLYWSETQLQALERGFLELQQRVFAVDDPFLQYLLSSLLYVGFVFVARGIDPESVEAPRWYMAYRGNTTQAQLAHWLVPRSAEEKRRRTVRSTHHAQQVWRQWLSELGGSVADMWLDDLAESVQWAFLSEEEQSTLVQEMIEQHMQTDASLPSNVATMYRFSHGQVSDFWTYELSGRALCSKRPRGGGGGGDDDTTRRRGKKSATLQKRTKSKKQDDGNMEEEEEDEEEEKETERVDRGGGALPRSVSFIECEEMPSVNCATIAYTEGKSPDITSVAVMVWSRAKEHIVFSLCGRADGSCLVFTPDVTNTLEHGVNAQHHLVFVPPYTATRGPVPSGGCPVRCFAPLTPSPATARDQACPNFFIGTESGWVVLCQAAKPDSAPTALYQQKAMERLRPVGNSAGEAVCAMVVVDRTLVVARADGRIQLLGLHAPSTFTTLVHHQTGDDKKETGLVSLAYGTFFASSRPDVLVSACRASDTVKVWDIRSWTTSVHPPPRGECVQTLYAPHGTRPCCVACHPTQPYIVCGGANGRVIGWDMLSGRCVFYAVVPTTLETYHVREKDLFPVTAIAFAPNGSFLTLLCGTRLVQLDTEVFPWFAEPMFRDVVVQDAFGEPITPPFRPLNMSSPLSEPLGLAVLDAKTVFCVAKQSRSM